MRCHSVLLKEAPVWITFSLTTSDYIKRMLQTWTKDITWGNEVAAFTFPRKLTAGLYPTPYIQSHAVG